MNQTLTPRGQVLAGAIARNFTLLDEHAKTHPEEVDSLVGTIVAHIRASRPHVLQVALLEEPRRG